MQINTTIVLGDSEIKEAIEDYVKELADGDLHISNITRFDISREDGRDGEGPSYSAILTIRTLK